MEIKKGIYLIADPSMEETSLLEKIHRLVREPLSAVQIWDHFIKGQDPLPLIEKIRTICHAAKIPVIINNQWRLLGECPLDGVHFDHLPADYSAIKQRINRCFISGLTCNNDLLAVQRAQDLSFDYISFCSLFPSSTENSCELVKFATVQKASALFKGLIFLAGGIKPCHLETLKPLPFDGIAILSGILQANDPVTSIQQYHTLLNDPT
jgi:thiamine-phosphate pyrophosphorylase